MAGKRELTTILAASRPATIINEWQKAGAVGARVDRQHRDHTAVGWRMIRSSPPVETSAVARLDQRLPRAGEADAAAAASGSDGSRHGHSRPSCGRAAGKGLVQARKAIGRSRSACRPRPSRMAIAAKKCTPRARCCRPSAFARSRRASPRAPDADARRAPRSRNSPNGFRITCAEQDAAGVRR